MAYIFNCVAWPAVYQYFITTWPGAMQLMPVCLFCAKLNHNQWGCFKSPLLPANGHADRDITVLLKLFIKWTHLKKHNSKAAPFFYWKGNVLFIFMKKEILQLEDIVQIICVWYQPNTSKSHNLIVEILYSYVFCKIWMQSSSSRALIICIWILLLSFGNVAMIMELSCLSDSHMNI